MARADEQPKASLADRFRKTRSLTLDLLAPLSDADATLQPAPDASPSKWHAAHTSWFFETFILRDHVGSYRLHDETFPFLFNSYYEGEGDRHARCNRGMVSRPSLDEVVEYRRVVDEAVLAALPGLPGEVRDLIDLGIQHEQQHQELFLTDILWTLSENPILPAYADGPPVATGKAADLGWSSHDGGQVEIGAHGGFSFDCERPRHSTLLRPYRLANRLITQGEWAEFMCDGGYSTPSLWLSDGWSWVTENGVEAPRYWRRSDDGEWTRFTLAGQRPLEPGRPVTHLSYYEADAFARWAGARLPTEAEWEHAYRDADPNGGNQLDEAGAVMPQGGYSPFGDCWQWTQSAYLPYPGFEPEAGTVGEYNGKFMCGQFVLKGASCATPRGHSRVTYRNFFYPHQRWQFTGVRLARNA